jgi:hypothetical protein
MNQNGIAFFLVILHKKFASFISIIHLVPHFQSKRNNKTTNPFWFILALKYKTKNNKKKNYSILVHFSLGI